MLFNKSYLALIINQHIAWPTVDNEPTNEYLTPFLATMAFPTLFPDGKGDPTNLSLNSDVHFDERIKHLKYAEKENGCTAPLPTLGLPTGL